MDKDECIKRSMQLLQLLLIIIIIVITFIIIIILLHWVLKLMHSLSHPCPLLVELQLGDKKRKILNINNDKNSREHMNPV